MRAGTAASSCLRCHSRCSFWPGCKGGHSIYYAPGHQVHSSIHFLGWGKARFLISSTRPAWFGAFGQSSPRIRLDARMPQTLPELCRTRARVYDLPASPHQTHATRARARACACVVGVAAGPQFDLIACQRVAVMLAAQVSLRQGGPSASPCRAVGSRHDGSRRRHTGLPQGRLKCRVGH